MQAYFEFQKDENEQFPFMPYSFLKFGMDENGDGETICQLNRLSQALEDEVMMQSNVSIECLKMFIDRNNIEIENLRDKIAEIKKENKKVNISRFLFGITHIICIIPHIPPKAHKLHIKE